MPVKILMVCLGNICRSPLAEGIMRSKLPADKFVVDSCGTGRYNIGERPDKRSILVAQQRGLDISCGLARQLSAEDFNAFDHIFVMDNANFRDVIKIAPDDASKAKVQMMMDALHPGKLMDVPDPYFGTQEGFDKVYEMLDEACTVVAEKLIKEHS